MAAGPLPPQIIGFTNQTLIKFEQKMHFIIVLGTRTANTGPRSHTFAFAHGASELRPNLAECKKRSRVLRTHLSSD